MPGAESAIRSERLLDRELLERLERIEGLLREIRDEVKQSWRGLLVRGFLRGSGYLIGVVVAVAMLGAALSFFGVIPGLETIAARFQEILQRQGY